MVICYKKLWKLLIDRDLNKADLQKLTGISSATIMKFAKYVTFNTWMWIKICAALHCDTSDIMEISEVNPAKARAARGRSLKSS